MHYSEHCEALDVARKRHGEKAPHLTKVRNVLKGQTYKRGRKETRGRPLVLTPRKLRRLLKKRKELIKKAAGEEEVTYKKIKKSARVNVSTPVISNAFKKMGIQFRPMRLKPQRTKETMKARVEICEKWKRLPADFFLKKVDMITDLKKFEVPTSARGRTHLRKLKVTRYRTVIPTLTPMIWKPAASGSLQINHG